MILTCKGLTYAKFSSGGAGNAVSYTGGAQASNLVVKADVNFQFAEGSDYADGIRVAFKKKMVGVSSAFELADLPAAIKKALLNWVTATNDLLISDKEPDFYGIGFYIWNETPVDETDQWIGIWIYKQKFTMDSLSASTGTDSISYQHYNVQGTGVGVQLSSGGPMAFAITNDSPLTSEAAAIAWLQTQAGITGGSGNT